jgi:hypothetical protein
MQQSIPSIRAATPDPKVTLRFHCFGLPNDDSSRGVNKSNFRDKAEAIQEFTSSRRPVHRLLKL